MQKLTSKKYLYIGALVVGIFLLAVADGRHYLDTPKSFIITLTQPVTKPIVSAGKSVTNFFSFFGSVGSLSQKNKQLEEDVRNLKSQLASKGELENENSILRQEIGLLPRGQFNLVPAEVLFSDPSNLVQFVLINKGKKNGVSEGMAVLASGILVGRVVEVSGDSSKVLLATDSTSAIPAMIQQTRVPGILKGQIGSSLLMDLIPQGEQIKPGDLVVTSGLGETFPKGILVGEIESVKAQENQPLQQAQVRTLLNFKKLEIVEIVIGVK